MNEINAAKMIAASDAVSLLNRRAGVPRSAGAATLNESTFRPVRTGVGEGSVSALGRKTGQFNEMLGREVDRRSPGETSEDEGADSLRQTAQTLVNQFFMGSMLKQMRDSPFKSEIFSGGHGGDAYAGLFDQHIAEHAGSRVAKDLVGSMVRQYQRTSAAVKQPSKP